MKTVIVIVGPTASGKTKLSIDIAKILDGEIISADSMQVYKYMDIGTAKPDTEEMSGIKHYLIDEIYPDEEYNVAKFQQLALEYIDEIIQKNKVPIIVGGTGLYINSLIYNLNFSETISDWGLRENLKKVAEEKGNKYLHERLREVDPEAAESIHENNVKRVIRALEVYEHTKKPISYHQEISRAVPPKYRFAVIGLRMERQRLYDRINKRVDIMMEKGLVEEVRNLVKMGYDSSTIAMQGIGYKEILSYIRGEVTLEDAVYIIKRDSRHYAKRQITWFKKIEYIHWIDVDKYSEEAGILENIKYYIASFGIFL
ncbi:MAG: tRNA (adenosine(37)-N6)-dimethylallyltransferase MiaA [Clostridia bacterium]|nr:tRNA (adenosine(37)-N6)-dimethylallyltransferase MiaA [Clostridia bacterium]